MIKIAQGAEAVIYKDNNKIIKERLSKAYRLKEIDESLRKFRTRREAKILGRLEEVNFPAPHLQSFCDKRMEIVMDFVAGNKLRDVIEEGDAYQKFAKQIGERVGVLHQKDIIHGDLTTSNMIVSDSGLKLIDFGLSSFSDRVEDKAVDLFLLDRALESKHYEIYPAVFDNVLESYKETYREGAELVLKRFEQVRMRGRNKIK
ncbi:Kae1-associated serine/threonine protein kinase [Candidatus Woesearchaeota archaeon]|nr:Kae1-associated serine/threonine protein kinase [Candidatus Woesearchaeota archaeon]